MRICLYYSTHLQARLLSDNHMTKTNLAEALVLLLVNATCFVYDDHESTRCQSGGRYKHVLLSREVL